MYTGSADFQTANSKPIQKQRITGTVNAVPFTAAHILTGSLTITNQCSDSSDTKIGAVYISKLQVTFLPNLPIPASSWKNRKIVVNFGLCIDEEHDTWEDFQLGVWYVSEANITLNGIAVTAYDVMSRFDKPLPASYVMSGQVAQIARAVCEACNVGFGMTDLEAAVLPNGTRPLGLYIPNDCVTYRDVLYWLSATVGGFATINRLGKLVFRAYENIELPPQVSISDTKRVTGARFSDFATDFGSIVFDNEDGTQQRIGAQGVGATYYAGFNPFAQFGTEEARTVLRTNIFLSVKSMQYTPFNVSLMSAPIYELGDPVEFTGGIVYGNDKIGVVQSITYKAGQGVQISGFGADPALQDVQTASEKANSAASRAQQNSEIVYKDYTNITPIAVAGGDPVQVVEINFTTNKKTDVEMWHEIQVTPDLSGSSMTVEAVYYLDGVELDRKPVETYTDEGKHLLGLHYFRNIEESGSHKWEVYLETTGGDLAIDQFGAIAVLKGQGLSKVDSWGGVIILEDDMVGVPRIIPFGVLTDTVSVSVAALNYKIEVSDTIVAPAVAIALGVLSDSMDLILYRPTDNIVSEDGDYNFITEDGEFNIVTD